MAFTKGSSIAIILINWNGFAYTKACIESLHQMEYGDYEIILIDNGSVDGSFQRLSKLFPEVTFIQAKENLGFTGGNNLGINYALEKGFGYVLLLNNDTVVKSDFLYPLINALNNGRNCGAVQPLIYFLHDQEKIWNAGGKFVKWTVSSKTLYHMKDSHKPYHTDWITGCAVLVKATVIKKIGLLDDTYFAYFEDVDWSLRMKKAGYELLVVPHSVVYHEAGASSKSKTPGKEGILSPQVHYLNVRNQLFQLRRHASFPFGIVAWPYQMVKVLMIGMYFTGRGRWEKLKAIRKGLVDGLKEQRKGSIG